MSRDRLTVDVRHPGFVNLLAFKRLIPGRAARFESAPADPIPEVPPVNALASALHPPRQDLAVASVARETQAARTYRLVPESGSLATFRPGQYLSFRFDIEGARVTRPYSISSSPKDAERGFYEITVKRNEGGYVSNYIWERWAAGTKVSCGGPEGSFYHEGLRDRRALAGIAGGCGITPFRSMARAIAEGGLDVDLTLFYGCNSLSDLLYAEEFGRLERASGGRFRLVKVLANESAEGCERGFVTAELLRSRVDPAAASFFVCGPQAMYDFIRKELATLSLPRRAVRWELFGEIKRPELRDDYPKAAAGARFKALVRIGGAAVEIAAAAGESVLVAMERAGLAPPSSCRSGECGYCRSLLVRGEVYAPDEEDGRRMADRELGFIHPCACFPLSDLEIVVPRMKG